jgi:hypothetical protein
MHAREQGSPSRQRRRELLRALLEEEQAQEPREVDADIAALLREMRRGRGFGGLSGLLSSEQLQGFVWGLGAAAVLMMVMPAAKQSLRPFAVTTVKGAMDLMDQVKTLFGEAGEGLQDIIAEAQFERVKGAAAPTTPE